MFPCMMMLIVEFCALLEERERERYVVLCCWEGATMQYQNTLDTTEIMLLETKFWQKNNA